jgi:hypothetical protein
MERRVPVAVRLIEDVKEGGNIIRGAKSVRASIVSLYEYSHLGYRRLALDDSDRLSVDLDTAYEQHVDKRRSWKRWHTSTTDERKRARGVTSTSCETTKGLYRL